MHPIYDQTYEVLFVVCHEAGAAEVLSSLVKNRKFYKKICICTVGPAKEIFQKKLQIEQNSSLEEIKTLGARDLVLTGRSLVPELERDAVRLAKSLGILTATYLDHWVNFRDFFLPLPYKSQENDQELIAKYLPDIILVGDQYAYQQAYCLFKERVSLIENEYVNDLKKEAAEILNRETEGATLLFIADPLSIDNQNLHNGEKFYGFDEFDLIQEVFEKFNIFKDKGLQALVIRPHPNHDIGIFKSTLAERGIYENEWTIIDNESDLLKQIAVSKFVIGIESMALAIAAELGKKVFSYIPANRHNKDSLLPYENIIKIKSLEEIEENDSKKSCPKRVE